MEQNSEEWFKEKEGKASASDINRILGKEGLKKTIDAINTYALEKAVEDLFGRNEEDEIYSKDIERGRELEPVAFSLAKDIKSYDFINVYKCGFIRYNEYSGASPDGLIGENAVLEIKAPRRNKFYKLVANGISDVDIKWIDQMQMQMMCTKRDRASLFLIHVEKGFKYWHEIFVFRDEERIDLIDRRIKEFSEKKLSIIEKIKYNQQW